jgi:hypothetical protein
MYKLKVTTIGSFLGVVLPQAVLDKLEEDKLATWYRENAAKR